MTVEAPAEWISGLADEGLKTNPSIQSFKSVDDLAKSFIETKALVGKKGVILPGDGAKAEEWEPVYDALGRPKSADDYKMPDVKLKDGMQMNEAQLKDFRAHAWKSGMSQKHFEQTLAFRFQQQMSEYDAHLKSSDETRKSTETALRNKWGAAYEERIAGVNKLLSSMGGDRAEEFVKKYGSDPDAIAVLGEILPHLSEATIGNFGIKKGGNLTPEEAKAEIAKIRADEKHPHNLATHPDHEKAIEDMRNLYALAHPGKK